MLQLPKWARFGLPKAGNYSANINKRDPIAGLGIWVFTRQGAELMIKVNFNNSRELAWPSVPPLSFLNAYLWFHFRVCWFTPLALRSPDAFFLWFLKHTGNSSWVCGQRSAFKGVKTAQIGHVAFENRLGWAGFFGDHGNCSPLPLCGTLLPAAAGQGQKAKEPNT